MDLKSVVGERRRGRRGGPAVVNGRDLEPASLCQSVRRHARARGRAGAQGGVPSPVSVSAGTTFSFSSSGRRAPSTSPPFEGMIPDRASSPSEQSPATPCDSTMRGSRRACRPHQRRLAKPCVGPYASTRRVRVGPRRANSAGNFLGRRTSGRSPTGWTSWDEFSGQEHNDGAINVNQ